MDTSDANLTTLFRNYLKSKPKINKNKSGEIMVALCLHFFFFFWQISTLFLRRYNYKNDGFNTKTWVSRISVAKSNFQMTKFCK